MQGGNQDQKVAIKRMIFGKGLQILKDIRSPKQIKILRAMAFLKECPVHVQWPCNQPNCPNASLNLGPQAEAAFKSLEQVVLGEGNGEALDDEFVIQLNEMNVYDDEEFMQKLIALFE